MFLLMFPLQCGHCISDCPVLFAWPTSWPGCSHSILITQGPDLHSVNYLQYSHFGRAVVPLLFCRFIYQPQVLGGLCWLVLHNSWSGVVERPAVIIHSNVIVWSDFDGNCDTSLLYSFRMSIRFILVRRWHGSLCLHLSKVDQIIQPLLRRTHSSAKP